jgi:PhnB protein
MPQIATITKTTLTPYLMLNGKAKEVMKFYQQAIGGELQIRTFGEAQGPECPLAIREQVMHAVLKHGDFVLMASDGNPEMPAAAGSNVQLSVGAPEGEIERLFNALVKGGQAIHPLFDAPWGGKFGVLTDRYGFHWMFASSHG